MKKTIFIIAIFVLASCNSSQSYQNDNVFYIEAVKQIEKQGHFFLWPLKGDSKKEFLKAYGNKYYTFGLRKYIFINKRLGYYDGINILPAVDKNVYSICKGKVIYITPRALKVKNGNFIVEYKSIKPANIIVKGMNIKKGDYIGRLAGCSISLFLKLTYKSRAIDPIWFLDMNLEDK